MPIVLLYLIDHLILKAIFQRGKKNTTPDIYSPHVLVPKKDRKYG